jgi:glycosyltransferase involved in cell wall biosynthesis
MDEGFAAYLRARAAVMRMKAAAGAQGEPSTYWADELSNIDYMIEATPLIVRKLRHHAFHVTAVRPYDYRIKSDNRRQLFEARLAALRELGGDSLLVPEHPALGGFGYDIDGALFNIDTLKFYEVLIGMQRGGVLDAVRARPRPVVCEIGAGWGGFAYQFKTLFPNSTYVVVDFPELFLFSGTYLGTVFPQARLVFCHGDSDRLPEAWETADFVFVPHHRLDLMAAASPHLAVNMVSFQEMTDAQVREYARVAAGAGCPLLYSLNRERSGYNTELTSVSAALSPYYRLTEIEVLGTDYTMAMKQPPKRVRSVRLEPDDVRSVRLQADRDDRQELNYRHLAGRLRDPASRQVALGMTLHNNAGHLAEAVDSLLAQTHRDFVLVMLDDHSTDGTETIARACAARDSRLRYYRHDARQGMIATWREVAELARRECPAAECFAWVSDHDRWHPRWLERLLGELERAPEAVLAYPTTRRLTPDGQEIEKGPRRFDTTGMRDRRHRWSHFCRHGVGAGDMVYGLMRFDALREAGTFRPVLRPDRLLVAELVLQGEIRQVPEVLWFRRQSAATSVERQRHTLMLAGTEPRWFWWPPWLQHAVMLNREYAGRVEARFGLTRAAWRRMLLTYQLTYGWRHVRKTETSHAVGRTVDGAIWIRKRVKHYYHHAVYHTLVGGRAAWGKTRRAGRRALYEVLMFTHRTGLRGQR